MSDVVANAERGEHLLTLGGVEYLLRPTYGAQIKIETATGKSYGELVNAASTGALHIGHARVIAAELIRAGATDDLTRRVSVERIGELIYEEGMPFVAPRLTLVLLDALRGGRTASGEAKAVAEDQTPTGTATADC